MHSFEEKFKMSQRYISKMVKIYEKWPIFAPVLINYLTMTTTRKMAPHNRFSHGFSVSVAPELALTESFRIAHISALDIKNRVVIL